MKLFDLSINDCYVRTVKAATISQALEQVPVMFRSSELSVYNDFACVTVDDCHYELSLME